MTYHRSPARPPRSLQTVRSAPDALGDDSQLLGFRGTLGVGATEAQLISPVRVSDSKYVIYFPIVIAYHSLK